MSTTSFVRAAIVVSAVVGWAGSASAGNAIILDTFDGPLGALGQNRTLDQLVRLNELNLPNPLTTAVDQSLGIYTFASGPGVIGEGFITYDRFPGGGLDAVAMGIEGFELELGDLDLNFPLTIELSTFDDMDQVIGSAQATVRAIAGKTSIASIGLESFQVQGAFNRSDIDQIVLSFNSGGMGTVALDFSLSEFRAVVPAPPVLGLLAAGGLAVTRRRRRG